MPEKLPKGWVKTTLGEIRIDASLGISQQQMRGETFELYSVPAFEERKPEILPGEKIGSNKITIASGDVLLCKINPRINRAWVVAEQKGHPQIGSTEWIVFSKQEGVAPEFLAYFFGQDTFRNYLSTNVSGVGGSLMRVRPAVVEKYPISLPPSREQERIVEKLDALLSRVAAGEAAARRALERLKRYRTAVLHAAVTGELTRDWRKKTRSLSAQRESSAQLLERLIVARRERWEAAEIQRLKAADRTPKDNEWRKRYREPVSPNDAKVIDTPRSWALASLDQCFQVERGKFSVRPRNDPAYYDGAHPFVQIGNLPREGGLITEYSQTLNDKGLRVSKKFPRGTILIAIVGATIANTGVLGFDACCPDSLVAVQTTDETLRGYADIWLRANKLRLRGFAAASGGQPNINLGILLPFSIALPPLAEQEEIVREVERRLFAADRLARILYRQIERGRATRQSLLREAFAGSLVRQNPDDEPASALLERIQNAKRIKNAEQRRKPRKPSVPHVEGASPMKTTFDPKSRLEIALAKAEAAPTANKLFSEGEFKHDAVYEFYDAIADSPEAIKRLRGERVPLRARQRTRSRGTKQIHPFRLHELWIKKFKNLEDYLVRFESEHALDVLLGWNGTGKSNLFEVLIVIFRDLYKWQVKDKWQPEPSLDGYRIRYEIDGRLVEISWDKNLRRPEPMLGRLGEKPHLVKCKREETPLPHFVFGYYSGPSNRFAELFSEPKQDHYQRLLEQKTDDEATLAKLLEERRFFNAETHHAKYALLAFFYEHDKGIRTFLKKHLRIENLESVLFVLKRPLWHRNNDPEDFWGADGLLRPVLERLRRHSIGQMVLRQQVDDGPQESARDHYYLLLPDLDHLQTLGAEYKSPTSFFVALESTDFSSIIHDVRIRIRVNATATKQTVITFKEMSEGEQQLLMVLGLLRFTKMSQSLVLLDEPDTHLNPHWQLGYLHLLLDALVGKPSDSKATKRPAIEDLEKRLTSQVLLSTHDPLAIAGLLKENLHLLKRNEQTEECVALPATEDPRGMGFTGILTGEMFGLKSDLDDETLSLLDRQAFLAGKKKLTSGERKQLAALTESLERLGFKSASSDPYYRAFLQGMMRRRTAREVFAKPTWNKSDLDVLKQQTDEILEEIEQEEVKQ